MKKVCCIGTSHIGAMKGGWDEMAAQWPGVKITFFGAPNLHSNEESLKHLALQGRKIVPVDRDVMRYYRLTSGGETDIEVDAYDAFIVLGGLGLLQPFNLYSLYRTDEQYHDDENLLISSDCLVEALAELFRTTYAYRLTTALYQLTRKPVFLVPDPRPSAGLLVSEGSSIQAWDVYIQLIKKLRARGDHVAEAKYYQAAFHAIRQPGVAIVDGPADVVVDGLFTPHEFCRESVWLQNERFETTRDDDFFHMNNRYGSRVLSEILTRGNI